MPTVSLCIIARDEAEVLARCLESVKGFPDEIIIVDTGSKDNTVEIAESFGAKVYHFEWVKDFAKARNFSFSKATCDYIFWIDCDDVLLPEELAKLQATKPILTRDMYLMWYDYSQDQYGRSLMMLPRERLMKRSRNFKWRYPIHENIDLALDYELLDIVITHKRTAAGYAADHNRNIDILEVSIKTEEYKNDPRIHYYLAKEYQDSCRFLEAAGAFKKFLKMNNGWYEDRIMAFGKLAECFLYASQQESDNAKKYRLQEKAKAAALEAIGMDFRIAEPYYVLGILAWDLQRHAEAAHWFDICRSLKKPNLLSPLKTDLYTWLPALQAAVMHYNLGDYKTAYECNEQAAKYIPNDSRIEFNRKLLGELLGLIPKQAPPKVSDIKIAFTGKNTSLDAPQFRIRTLNISKQLDKLGYNSVIIDFSEIEQYDVIVFGQESLNLDEMRRAKSLGKRVVLNLCEALFEFDFSQYTESIETADLVVCCSTKLADLVRKNTSQENVEVIEDAVENDFGMNCSYDKDDSLVVGWAGMGGSSPPAEKLRPIIEKLGCKLITIHEHDNADIKWNRETWQQELVKCDIAIAPADYEKQPAKSNNRLTTYMSLGLPVIASPLQAYLEIIENGDNGFVATTDEEWEQYFKLLKHKEERKRIGQAGKEIARRFSLESIARRWGDLLTEDKTVDIIVTTYGGGKYLDECLKSIEACTSHPHNVIVVDAKQKGLNFSQAINKGIQQGKAPYVCFLNDDVIVTKGWLSGLVKNIRDNIGFSNPLSNCDKYWLHEYNVNLDGVDLGPGTTTLTDTHKICVKGHESVIAEPSKLYDIKSPGSRVYHRDWVAFYCTVMSRDLINKVGLLDEEFKTGSEDLDYCTRANRLGYKCCIDENVFVYHAGGVSRKAHEDENYQKHQEEDRYNNARISFKYDKKLVVIQTGWAYDLWDGNTLREKGLGGSETAATRMAEEFAKLGYRVVVFAQTGKDRQTINGVEWYDQRDWNRFIYMNHIDVMIVSRYVDFIFDPIRASQKYLWTHDIFLIPGNGEEAKQKGRKAYDVVDGIFVLSTWHKQFFSDWYGVSQDKLIITGNGIDTERFEV